MADQKITQLGALTMTVDDLLTFIQDPAGTPLNKKIALSDFLAAILKDEDDMVSDSAVFGATQQSIKAFVEANAGDLSTLNAPRGFLQNGKIVVSVTSNNLTVALKGLDGNDPSASNKVYVRIGDTVRTITSALSVTKNAGTNWFNSGGAELATKEVDYFVYLGYNATDGVTIGFSRIPYAQEYSEFSATTTNEKYAAISDISNAASGDDYENVGRFAAILSAGAGYTWTVPTFSNINLINRPIYETRWLAAASQYTGFSAAPTSSMRYKLVDRICYVQDQASGGTGTSNATTLTQTLPFASAITLFLAAWGRAYDNGAHQTLPAQLQTGAGSNTLSAYKTNFQGAWTASGAKVATFGVWGYEI